MERERERGKFASTPFHLPQRGQAPEKGHTKTLHMFELTSSDFMLGQAFSDLASGDVAMDPVLACAALHGSAAASLVGAT